MEYLTLSKGHLISIILPLTLIFNKIIDFQATYFLRIYEKRIKIVGAFIGLISAILFYINNYGEYICFIWFGMFTLMLYILIAFDHFLKRKVIVDSDTSFDIINWSDNIISFTSISLGALFIIISATPLHILITSVGSEDKMALISRMIYVILGISYIILNKVVFSKILLVFSFLLNIIKKTFKLDKIPPFKQD